MKLWFEVSGPSAVHQCLWPFDIGTVVVFLFFAALLVVATGDASSYVALFSKRMDPFISAKHVTPESLPGRRATICRPRTFAPKRTPNKQNDTRRAKHKQEIKRNKQRRYLHFVLRSFCSGFLPREMAIDKRSH